VFISLIFKIHSILI